MRPPSPTSIRIRPTTGASGPTTIGSLPAGCSNMGSSKKRSESPDPSSEPTKRWVGFPSDTSSTETRSSTYRLPLPKGGAPIPFRHGRPGPCSTCSRIPVSCLRSAGADGLPLDGPSDHPANVELLQEDVQAHGDEHHQERTRGEEARIELELPNRVDQGNRGGHATGIRRTQQQGKEEVVPDPHELEHGDGRQGGKRHRQDDLEEPFQAGSPIDASASPTSFGQARKKVALDRPNPRRTPRRMKEHQRYQRVFEFQADHDPEDRG